MKKKASVAKLAPVAKNAARPGSVAGARPASPAAKGGKARPPSPPPTHNKNAAASKSKASSSRGFEAKTPDAREKQPQAPAQQADDGTVNLAQLALEKQGSSGSEAGRQKNSAAGRIQAKWRQMRGGAGNEEALAEEALWECLTDSGWEAYDKDYQDKIALAWRKGNAGLTFDLSGFEYSFVFLGPGRAEQTNLTTERIRPVRNSVLEKKIDPAAAGGSGSQQQYWARSMSHDSIGISQDGRSIWSVDENKKSTRAAIGASLMARGAHEVRLTYDAGNVAFLCAGVVDIDDSAMQSQDGELLTQWNKVDANSTHKGLWLYSFYYHAYSVDGSDWTHFDRDRASEFEDNFEFKPGDELIMSLEFNGATGGTLQFGGRKKDKDEDCTFGVVASGLKGTFRPYALLGSADQRLTLTEAKAPAQNCPWIEAAGWSRCSQSKPLKTILSDTAMRGINLRQLISLGGFVKSVVDHNSIKDSYTNEIIKWTTVNMYHINQHFVMPLTQAEKCSYAEFVTTGRQAPQWMISHAWSTAFPSTLKMLQLHSQLRHRDKALETFYWCCTFANNQHDLSELKEDDIMQSPFARVLTSPATTGMVLLCDPTVTPMTRVWCVFEMHLTESLREGKFGNKDTHFLDVAAIAHSDKAAADCELVATMLQDALQGNWHEQTEEEGVYFPLEVARVGTKVDIAKAQASVVADRNAILNYVATTKASRQPPPQACDEYVALNSFIHSIFASAELYRLACERPEGCLEAAQHLLQLRCDPNKFTRKGNTPLFAVVGADPQAAEAAQDTVLIPFMKLLLGANSDPNRLNSDNKTVLDACGDSVTEVAKKLLEESGAKTFEEIAPAREKELNVMLADMARTVFASFKECHCFGGSGGGGDGSKLLAPIEGFVFKVAAVLKQYPKANCAIGTLLTKLDKFGRRGPSIQRALEADGCQNQFDAYHVQRGPLVTITVSFSDQTTADSAK
eukprot:TRINITY_DN54555_c0_g1_i2.p1 TRINITY_DN54555_c0_g1~~TRINITY_DN54555_c0_g1_i2.p1  ORF type:complete len:964 (-),score=214.96 TRINITY_DN54555_c0_g1_i2:44-2935(-)